jgi:hypothetical protein
MTIEMHVYEYCDIRRSGTASGKHIARGSLTYSYCWLVWGFNVTFLIVRIRQC